MTGLKTDRWQGFVNGAPEGKCTVYDRRGRIVQEMNYRNGRLDGTMTRYDGTGKAVSTVEYEDGAVKRAPPPAVGKQKRHR